MAWKHSGLDLAALDSVHFRLVLLSLLNALHDHLEYPEGTEVGINIPTLVETPDADSHRRFFAWYLFGVSGCLSPILYSTVNTIVKNDSEERALIMVRISTSTTRSTLSQLIPSRAQ